MRLPRSIAASLGIVLGLWGAGVTPAAGSVVAELRIASEPEGATVYLKRGRREVPLGETPLVYEAKFHSEISVLRLVLRKPGYEELVLKVSPKDPEVVATLTPVAKASLVTDPARHKVPAVAALQKEINPDLASALRDALEREEMGDFQLVAPAALVDRDGEIYVELVLGTGSEPQALQGGRQAQRLAVESLWSRLERGLVTPLTRPLVRRSQLTGLALEVRLEEVRHTFGTTPRIEQRVEMQCRPGYRPCQRFDPCAQRDGRNNCVAGMVTSSCYDPCHVRVPVVKSDVEIDTRVGVGRGSARARFLVPFAVVSPGRVTSLEEIPYALENAKGRLLLQNAARPMR